MNVNFELILFYAILICAVIVLIDFIFLKKSRKNKKLPVMIEYARSFLPILVIVFLFRSFLFEAYRIPSGSLEPTLLIGDFILVNKFDYGIRLPVIHKKIYSFGEPQRGDIMVFRFPPDPSINFIKRVIGIPGDHISYINKVLYVNGKEIPQTLEKTLDNDDETVKKQENFFGVKHFIYQTPLRNGPDFEDIVVPPGMYFMMGDNRDNSADSREWGFVPEANIVGKAQVVLLSWNADGDLLHKLRWNRMGTLIH